MRRIGEGYCKGVNSHLEGDKSIYFNYSYWIGDNNYPLLFTHYDTISGSGNKVIVYEFLYFAGFSGFYRDNVDFERYLRSLFILNFDYIFNDIL
jgi:hypothetical protein